jgi:hypothetical protein
MAAKPNLFHYATSELSQDAFICWLIDWSNFTNYEFDKNMTLIGQTFLQVLLKKQLLIFDIKVGRQYKNIDVYAIVNDKYFLIIEDKKGTSEHSNQLERYANVIDENEKWKHLEKILVYFKMEEQSNLEQVKNAGYRFIDRHIMIKTLNTYFSTVPDKLQNGILRDYYEDLLILDETIRSYSSLKIADWHSKSWMGYFSTLQKDLNDPTAGWSYVSNPSGGFMGFWFNFKSLNEYLPTMYIQIQEKLLTIRIASDSKETNAKYVDPLRNAIIKAAKKHNLLLEKYGSQGKSMGIFKLQSEFLKTDDSGILVYDQTLTLLKEVAVVINEAMAILQIETL